MGVLIVSFHIADDKSDHVRRRQGICDAIEASGGLHWKGTDSFYLVETDTSPIALTKTLKGCIDEEQDIVLVHSPELGRGYVAGLVRDRNLFELMPHCKRV